MAHEQIQAACNRCRCLTLHTRDYHSPNHLVHALVTLFLCGLWIPVWIIVACTCTVPPFRCNRCGQVEGEMTPEQAYAYAVAQQSRVDRQQVGLSADAEEAASRQRIEARRKEVAAHEAAFHRKQIPGKVWAWYLRTVHNIAGDGNDLLRGFLHGMIPAVLFAAIVLGTFLVTLLF